MVKSWGEENNKMEAHRSPIANSRKKKKNMLKKPQGSGRKRLRERYKSELSQSVHYHPYTQQSTKQLYSWLLARNCNITYTFLVIFLSLLLAVISWLLAIVTLPWLPVIACIASAGILITVETFNITIIIVFHSIVWILYLYNKVTMGMVTNQELLLGKNIIVTGGTRGIGLETAREFSRRGASVIITADSGGVAAVKDIKETTGNKHVRYLWVDLMSYKSVREFVRRVVRVVSRVDIIVNNAGVWIPGPGEDLSQINYYSHFLLTHLLLEQLSRAGQARIINVSSCLNVLGELDLNKVHYVSYSTSKLMNILFTREISRRWQSRGITSYSLHPGFVRTTIFDRHFLKNLIILISYISGKTSAQGAQTSIYLATQPGIENMSGQHFADCRHTWWTRLWTNKAADDQVLACKLWELSEEVVGIKHNTKGTVEKSRKMIMDKRHKIEDPQAEECEDLVGECEGVLLPELSKCVEQEVDVVMVRRCQVMQSRFLTSREEEEEDISRGR